MFKLKKNSTPNIKSNPCEADNFKTIYEIVSTNKALYRT